MKKLITSILIVLVILSCENKSKKIKTIKVTDNIIKIEVMKDTLYITENEYQSIQSLSIAARDVAIYFITNKDKWGVDDFTFYCNNYHIWIANDYQFLKLYKPVQYELTKKEKDYFWKMYKNYQKKDMRLYNWESELEIIIQK